MLITHFELVLEDMLDRRLARGGSLVNNPIKIEVTITTGEALTGTYVRLNNGNPALAGICALRHKDEPLVYIDISAIVAIQEWSEPT